MKWTTLTSIFFCAANFITSLAVLIISCYNIKVTSNKDYRLPLSSLDKWRNYLTHIIPAMIYVVTISVLSCWGVTRKRKPVCAMMVMLLHGIALVLCSIYTDLISAASGDVTVNSLEMKNNTLKIYQDHFKHHDGDTKWVPIWLSEIQEQSTTCCGILGYDDWKEFWPETPTEVPETCCRKDVNKCIRNFDHIEWPDTPSQYIKAKEGCSALINDAMKERLGKTVNLIVILTTLLGISFLNFALHYACEFCIEEDNANNDSAAATLTIGETWARMGFSRPKNKRQKKTQNYNKNVDDCPDLNFDILPNPGSYTDFYLKQLQATNSAECNQPDCENQTVNNSDSRTSNIGNTSNNEKLPATSDPNLAISDISIHKETNRDAAKSILQQLRYQTRPYYGGRK